jgi:hypothetical protein
MTNNADPSRGTTMGLSAPDDVSLRLERIATLAKQTPKMVLRSLAYHITPAHMARAYALTRKGGARGVMFSMRGSQPRSSLGWAAHR